MENKIDYTKIANRVNEVLGLTSKSRKYYNGKPLAEHFNDEMLKYAFVFGQKANGKTTWWLMFIVILSYWYDRKVSLMRRWDEAFKGNRANEMFSSINANGWIKDATDGKYDGVAYYRKCFYFYVLDNNNEKVKMSEPFMYCRSLTSYENDNGTQIDRCAAILFDEFIPRGRELPDEVNTYFFPCVSSIKRRNMDTIVIGCANSINMFSSYFEAFGMYNASTMPAGTIEVYQNAKGGKVALERAGNVVAKEEGDVYFAFGDLNKTKMITEGGWELMSYPRPIKYLPKHIIADFYIKFYSYCYRCQLVLKDNMKMINIYPYDYDKVNLDKDIIYTPDYDLRPNFRRNVLTRRDALSKVIVDCFTQDLVRFSDNKTGNVIDSYLDWCKQNRSVSYDK